MFLLKVTLLISLSLFEFEAISLSVKFRTKYKFELGKAYEPNTQFDLAYRTDSKNNLPYTRCLSQCLSKPNCFSAIFTIYSQTNSSCLNFNAIPELSLDLVLSNDEIIYQKVVFKDGSNLNLQPDTTTTVSSIAISPAFSSDTTLSTTGLATDAISTSGLETDTTSSTSNILNISSSAFSSYVTHSSDHTTLFATGLGTTTISSTVSNSLIKSSPSFSSYASHSTDHSTLFTSGLATDAISTPELFSSTIELETTPGPLGFQAINRLTLTGHTAKIISLAVFPNGDLATSSWDSTVKIWNTVDGTLKKTLNGHIGFVNSLAILANGDLASGGADSTIKIWDLNTGSPKLSFSTGLGNDVSALVTLKSGMLASGISSLIINTIKIYNPTTGTSIKQLTGHAGYLSSLIINLNGDLISGSLDTTILVWDVISFTTKHKLNAGAKVLSLLILENGHLASGLDDNSIKIWDTINGVLVTSLTNAHSNGISSMALLLGGNLASTSTDNSVKIWNTTDLKLIHTMQFTPPDTTWALTTLLNGDLACSIDTKVQIYY